MDCQWLPAGVVDTKDKIIVRDNYTCEQGV